MENEFSEIDALKVIRQSIEQTKESFREKGWFYLIVGWVVFLAAVANYCLILFNIRKDLDVIWTVLFLGIMAPLLYNLPKNRIGGEFNPDMTRSPLYYLWRGLSFMALVILFFDSRVMTNDTASLMIPFTVIVSLLGLAAYVSGAILKFRPLLIGGYVSIIPLAIVTTNTQIKSHPEYELLILAASVLCSFIIPGHLLRASK